MTHQEAVVGEFADRYIAGTLGPEESAAFEAHFFQCDECFAHAEATARLRHGVRHMVTAGELPLEVRAPIVMAARSSFPRWIPYAAAAALAGLAFWLPYSRAELLEERLAESERRASTLASDVERLRAVPPPDTRTADANVPIAVLQTTRSADAPVLLTLPPDAPRFVLWIDGAANAGAIDVALVAADGAEVARATGVAPNRDGALVVAFSSAVVPEGAYTVQQIAGGRVVARHAIAVARPGGSGPPRS